MGITINTDHSLSIKGSYKASIKRSISIYGSSEELPVTITADFEKIPENLHQVYFQAFVYQYDKGIKIFNSTERNIKARSKNNIDKIVELICDPKNWKIFKK